MGVPSPDAGSYPAPPTSSVSGKRVFTGGPHLSLQCPALQICRVRGRFFLIKCKLSGIVLPTRKMEGTGVRGGTRRWGCPAPMRGRSLRHHHARVLERLAKSQFVPGRCGCQKSSTSLKMLLKRSTPSITLALQHSASEERICTGVPHS